MRISIGQLKVKEKIHAPSSTQLSKLEELDSETILRVEIMLLCSRYQGYGVWTPISDRNPKCYSASMR